ncbi:hypothetical protein E3P92_02903 [Wallemia ichthyophaga]|uniref:Thiamine-binding protein domain-containing protein n=2 Tax=Wallemia ichthyophaga TaxID=245174 RepID=A0A4T0EA50_WALIC|nr:UPF0045 protein sll [Wallemia ichthyophaga EXF-994]TIA70888.1 hypothetical protein E3P91_02815 [Wallemia ichthyophaga]EOQ98786.1 UPF0045 protein sll [Wallemia ichthyophaga EXF-994]TIA80347.1 hypothetical protein E3P98_02753 [Wallemia ichthyophaga]TIA90137.1 hypothetical protein E3P97_02681 [Wallemia ichthyophaga]TIA97394.1 hypothetical protein E3P95_02885 [Wallemia ichthyophaga]
MYCCADFCLIPFGSFSLNPDNSSVADELAVVQRILAETRLTHKLNGHGTELEGEWDAVTSAVKSCHQALHDLGVHRICSDIRISTRIDKASGDGANAAKVKAVEDILRK